ncbi:MAG: FapA family protein [Patescibacteria group bacterium]|nr:FapA family protein [Patescibacteria group bacterium]
MSIKKYFLVFLIVLFAGFVIAPPAYAKTQKTILLPQNEIVNKDYFAGADVITLSGTVNGDVYAAGGTVTVDGTVNGDLIAAGGTVNIKGRVLNDLRVAGGQVVISGQIGGNITSMGGNVLIVESAIVNGSLVAAGGTVDVAAPIGKGATIAGGQINLANSVGGDIDAYVGNLSLSPKARINGNLIYWSESKAQIADGATVSGKTTQNIPKEKAAKAPEDIGKSFAAIFSFFKIVSFISYLIIGLLLIRFFKNFLQSVTNTIEKRPWMSLLVGFVTSIVFPMFFAIFLVTLVGIPIAFIALTLLLISIYLTTIFVSIFIGQLIFRWAKKEKGIYWKFILGFVIFEIITLIPILGWIIKTLAVLLGLGALLLEKKNLYSALRSKKTI